jgi:hypothetical protein
MTRPHAAQRRQMPGLHVKKTPLGRPPPCAGTPADCGSMSRRDSDRVRLPRHRPSRRLPARRSDGLRRIEAPGCQRCRLHRSVGTSCSDMNFDAGRVGTANRHAARVDDLLFGIRARRTGAASPGSSRLRADMRPVRGADRVAHIGARRVIARLVREDAVEHEVFLTPAMGVGVKGAVRARSARSSWRARPPPRSGRASCDPRRRRARRPSRIIGPDHDPFGEIGVQSHGGRSLSSSCL